MAIIKGGYILQPRIIDDSEIMNASPVVRELWQYLLRKVNFSDNKQFKRGQNFFSLAKIQEDLCWYVGYRKMKYSKPQLTKSLRRLREGNMIETAKATRGIVVTVCKYSYYQDPENYEGNDEGTAKEIRRKQEGHTINKNDIKKDKNDKKKYIYSDEIKNFTAQLVEYFPKTIVLKLTKQDKLEWIDTVEKLIRLDKHKESDILKAVKYARNDDFWKGNFLSLRKLRKKNPEKIKYIDVYLYKANSSNGQTEQIEFKYAGQALQRMSIHDYESKKSIILNNQFDIEPRKVLNK